MDLQARIPITPGEEPYIARITEDIFTEPSIQQREALLLREDKTLQKTGFRAVLRLGSNPRDGEIALPEQLSYLRAGDIVRVNRGAGNIRVIYRRNSRHNFLFLTERCNSRCLMCSQPPRAVDDSYLIDAILEAIPLMSPETHELCITGGEPTLMGARLIEIIQTAKKRLPKTSLHMLSNGRLLSYAQLAQRIADIGHPDLMIGIPLYSDIASKHDFVVQAKGAFDQTIRGIMNLARYKQKIEIRFVIHQQTVGRMIQTARFVTRNLPFVDQVALMGLEMTGFTRANLNALWIDPLDYQPQLRATVKELTDARVPVMIYNHQLCLLEPELRDFACKSISDWKNIYMSECGPCAIKENCGGFFVSAGLRYSRGIRPLARTA